jgi:hypothetical protein
VWAKGLYVKDIHKEMFPVYGGKCLSHTVVQNWVKKFSQGRSKIADDAQPGLPVKTATEATVQQYPLLVPPSQFLFMHLKQFQCLSTVYF